MERNATVSAVALVLGKRTRKSVPGPVQAMALVAPVPVGAVSPARSRPFLALADPPPASGPMIGRQPDRGPYSNGYRRRQEQQKQFCQHQHLCPIQYQEWWPRKGWDDEAEETTGGGGPSPAGGHPQVVERKCATSVAEAFWFHLPPRILTEETRHLSKLLGLT